MPDRLMDILFRFLRQDDGMLSKRAQAREFAEMTDAEAVEVKKIYAGVRQEFTEAPEKSE